MMECYSLGRHTHLRTQWQKKSHKFYVFFVFFADQLSLLETRSSHTCWQRCWCQYGHVVISCPYACVCVCLGIHAFVGLGDFFFCSAIWETQESKINRGRELIIKCLLIFYAKITLYELPHSPVTLFTRITGSIRGWQTERETRTEGWMSSVGKGYTCIKSCPSPVTAEADMSLVISRFCLWQKTEVHTFTITHMHTHTHIPDRTRR